MTVPFRAGGETARAASLAAVLAPGPQVLLADISEFQPQISDAAYLAWSKAIVIRAAYGDAHDDHAWYGGDRRDQLHAGGAKFLGIYQYLVNGQDGAAQASALHRLVGDIRPGEVLIADYEEGQRQMLTAWYLRMRQLYPQAAWPYLWTYTGLNFGNAHGVLPVEWIAAYQAAEPVTPHKLWQFTDAYNVPGVGTCDCSVFHGTIDQLAALAYPAPQEDRMFTIPGIPGNWLYGGFHYDPVRKLNYFVGGGTTGEVYYARSADDGKTWTLTKMP